MENIESTPAAAQPSNTVSVELSSEQYAFLTAWQKTHEKELGIEVPIGSMVRKAVDIAMKAERAKDEKPTHSDRPPRPFGDRPSFKPGMRKSFGGGDRQGAPRFGALGLRSKKTY